MKTFRNNKGFTLIELLAVIVILAIVMALTMATVLPFASKARKEAFATEVNTVISAAGEEMTMIAIDTHRHGTGLLTEGADYKRITSSDGNTTKYCFTMKKLVELGHLKKSQEALEESYKGYVVVTATKDQNYYTYKTKMHNTQYTVDTSKDEISSDEVNDYTKPGTDDSASYDCSNVS